MNKTQLIDVIAEKAELSKTQAKAALESTLTPIAAPSGWKARLSHRKIPPMHNNSASEPFIRKSTCYPICRSLIIYS